eukprot:4636268-Amphidinium_carterae.1
MEPSGADCIVPDKSLLKQMSLTPFCVWGMVCRSFSLRLREVAKKRKQRKMWILRRQAACEQQT